MHGLPRPMATTVREIKQSWRIWRGMTFAPVHKYQPFTSPFLRPPKRSFYQPSTQYNAKRRSISRFKNTPHLDIGPMILDSIAQQSSAQLKDDLYDDINNSTMGRMPVYRNAFRSHSRTFTTAGLQVGGLVGTHSPTNAVAVVPPTVPTLAVSAQDLTFAHDYRNDSKSPSPALSLRATANRPVSPDQAHTHSHSIEPLQSKSLAFQYASVGYCKTVPFQRINNGSHVIDQQPDPNSHWKSYSYGEDASFARHDALGVADGVGGWKDVAPNANPALFSKTLMHLICCQVEKDDTFTTNTTASDALDVAETTGSSLAEASTTTATSNDIPSEITDTTPDTEDLQNSFRFSRPKAVPRAQTALQESFITLEQEMSQQNVMGSTTVLVAILQDDASLSIAHLGDCGLIVIRGSEIAFRTEEQQHSFNFPYQLGTGSFDRPDDAFLYTVQVQMGDIVLLGSDGLFDNLFDYEIVPLVHSLGPDATPQLIAETVAKKAKEESENRRGRLSPFQLNASSVGMLFEGGKVDDIVVVVGKVVDPAYS